MGTERVGCGGCCGGSPSPPVTTSAPEAFEARQEDEVLSDFGDGEVIAAEWDRDLTAFIAAAGATYGLAGALTVRSTTGATNNLRVRWRKLANPGTLVGSTLLASATYTAPAVAAPSGALVAFNASGLATADLDPTINALALTIEALDSDDTVAVRAFGLEIGDV